MGKSGQRGKGGIIVPETGPRAFAQHIPELTQRAEIQDVRINERTSNGGTILGSVDCCGQATIAHIVPSEGMKWNISRIYQLQPNESLRESGWAGIAMSSANPGSAAIARHYAQDVTVFDGEVSVRTYNTIHPTTSVQLFSSSLESEEGAATLLAVSEGPLVSMWDVRVPGDKRIARLGSNPHNPHIYATAVSSEKGWIAATGADRSVSVWDTRTWRIVHRWSNCIKYEATALHFSRQNPSYCYVGGADYEVVLGEWAGEKRSRFGGGMMTGKDMESVAAFRGDSKWLGLSRAQHSDSLAGITANGELYVAEFM